MFGSAIIQTNDSKKKFHYGGQAVIEGVMMRGRDGFAIACRRKSDNEIVTACEPLHSILRKLKWLNKPFLRGTLAIVDAMALGIKSLTFSAEVAMADEELAKATTGKDGGELQDGPARETSDRRRKAVNDIAVGGAMVMAIGLAVALFMVAPAAMAKSFKPWTDAHVFSEFKRRTVLGLIEGGLKLGILLAYVSTISMWGEIRRVFAYHGAEHKTINAYEAGEPLEPEVVQRYPTAHVRCGTSFLLVVIVVSVLVFAAIPWNYLWQRVLYKLLLLPLVAGIAYEVIHLAGNRKESRFMRAVLAPGLLMQKITTKQPSDEQVEVAIKSLQLVLESEASAQSSTEQTSCAPSS